MRFSKIVTCEAMKLVFDEKFKVLKIKEEHKAEWVETMDLRYRGISRVASVNAKKKAPPSWMNNIINLSQLQRHNAK